MPTPATVTGTLQTLTSGRIAQGKVIFQLTNIGTGNPVGVSGTSIIPALTYVAMTAQDGSFSISLWGNDVLTPANTLYSVTFRDFQGNEIGPILYSITGGSANLNTLAATGTVTPPVIAASAIITNPTAPQSIIGQPLSVQRLTCHQGTPLVAGDFSISGWGTGASIAFVGGVDQAFAITITVGTAPSLNPTIILTFHDGAWSTAPVFVATITGNSASSASILPLATSTILTLTFIGTPGAGNYTTYVIGMGR